MVTVYEPNKETPPCPADVGSEIIAIVKDIVVDGNPRKNFDPVKLKQLANSMRDEGLINPITIYWGDDGKFHLAAGERRLRAAKMLKWKDITARVCDSDPTTVAIIRMSENFNRDDLNPIEQANSIKELLGKPVPNGKKKKNGRVEVFTGKVIAKMKGYTPGWVNQRLRLLDLPQPIQTAVLNEEIPFSYVRELLAIPSQEKQMQEFNKFMKSGKSGDSIQAAANEARAKRTAATGKKRGRPSDVDAVAEATDRPNIFKQSLEEAKAKLQNMPIAVPNKTRIREGMATGMEKFKRAKTDEKRAFYKGVLAGLEYASGMKEKV